jgi:hypothetical protein
MDKLGKIICQCQCLSGTLPSPRAPQWVHESQGFRKNDPTRVLGNLDTWTLERNRSYEGRSADATF